MTLKQEMGPSFWGKTRKEFVILKYNIKDILDKTRLKMQVWFFFLAIWLLFHILNFVGFRLNNCRCDQSTLTHTLLINERAAETPIIRPKSTKLGIEKAFGDDIGNIIEWKLTAFSRWIHILSERKTYTYISFFVMFLKNEIHIIWRKSY